MAEVTLKNTTLRDIQEASKLLDDLKASGLGTLAPNRAPRSSCLSVGQARQDVVNAVYIFLLVNSMWYTS